MIAEEIRGAFGEEGDITVSSTQQLVNLNAVINETLRLDPPVGTGGTYISYKHFAAKRRAYSFYLHGTFLPGRFIDAWEGDGMAGFNPVGAGRNSCIGVKSAYAEMQVVLTRLVWGFDMRVDDEERGSDCVEQATYIFRDNKASRPALIEHSTYARSM